MFYERNIIKKNPLDVHIRFASVYPNIYKTASSSLGYQIIYNLVNDREDSFCERVIYPNSRSIETNSPLMDFNIISFTLQYEQDYFNMLNILKDGKIPLRRDERDNSYPSIIAGGPCASSNPLPISDFIDVFIVGEGEAILNEFLDRYMEIVNSKEKNLLNNTKELKEFNHPSKFNLKSNNRYLKKKIDKNHLDLFLGIEGVYISKYDNHVKKAIVQDMDDAYQVTYPIVTVSEDDHYKPSLGDSILLNVSRGCLRACRFCMSGYLYRPLRESSIEKLLNIAKKARKNSNLNKVSLIGAAVSDYSDISKLTEELLKEGFQISTPSLRVESITKDMLSFLKKSGAKTITIAPESIYSIRKSLNKNISDDKIYEVVENALNLNLNLKLYFLIGCPNETTEDIIKLSEYMKNLNSFNDEMNKKKNSKNTMRFSVNPLIPKPHTPLQWEGYNIKAIKSKVRFLKSQVKGLAIKFNSPKLGLIQYVLSCKGSEIGRLLEESLEKQDMKKWTKYSDGYGLDDDLPWSNIDIGLNDDFLKNEREKLFNRDLTPWCGENSCYECGSCKDI